MNQSINHGARTDNPSGAPEFNTDNPSEFTKLGANQRCIDGRLV
jgi:hypothetical protein